MDKNAIQKFAVWARQELLKQVSQRAFLFGFTKEASDPADATSIRGRLLSREERIQRYELAFHISQHGFDQVIDEVAYTWFNRFIALRFMEVNDYLPSHIRVFTDANGNFKPELLSEALHLDLPGLAPEKVRALLSENRDEDLYRYLLLTQCNALHDILPRMFETMGSYTELLLPDNILHQDSILAHLVADIPTEDWQDQVQIIGWLYQFYISEVHDQVININRKGAINKSEIPAATQLFTPDWVVRYMVDNSLGRYWIERHPESKLAEFLDFYIAPSQSEQSVVQETVRPQDLRVIDPCMGSGHILVYAFDVLMKIYCECGYSERDATDEIITHNLFGLDIDDRCEQLAYFAVMMKARFHDRRFLSRAIQPHVLALAETPESLEAVIAPAFIPDAQQRDIAQYLLETFHNAKEIGSILSVKPFDYTALSTYLDQCEVSEHEDLNVVAWQETVLPLLKKLAEQAQILSQSYVTVCTNPPYMNKLDKNLKDFVTTYYKPFSADLFSVFMRRNFDWCCTGGFNALMTPFVWMFIKSYEELRNYVLSYKSITSIIQMEYSAFEEATVPICCFVLHNAPESQKGMYFRLSDFKGGMDVQKTKVLEAINNRSCGYLFESSQSSFSTIPGSPIAYWMSENFRRVFSGSQSLADVANARQGLATTDNRKFLRQWYEVSYRNIGYGISSRKEALESQKKWFPYNKGGEFRKWYGNQSYIVNWENDGEEIRKNVLAKYPYLKTEEFVVKNTSYYFSESVSWSDISSSSNAFRFFPTGFIFDVKGMSAFGGDVKWKQNLLAYNNTKFIISSAKMINPTISLQIGDYQRFPYAERFWSDETAQRAERLISIAKEDWDAFETSWNFTSLPLLNPKYESLKIAESYNSLRSYQLSRIDEMQHLEEENNRRFNEIYGLEEEIDPKVPLEQITLTCNPAYRYGGDKSAEEKEEQFKTDTVKELISYAVGCLFGRYSLDEPGLILANQGDGLAEYTAKIPSPTITPVESNIIAISDDEYAEGDLVSLFINWLRQAFGPEQLEANLNFIANALGGKGSARDIIRSYFLSGFYADHMKRYQKRPIYWLFDSGKKNGFKALMYLHRYTPDLIARLRTDYVHERQQRLRTLLSTIEEDKTDASNAQKSKLAKEEKKLREQERELNAFEEQVHHLADQNISIDLDDGVEANYERFQSILAKRK